MVMSNFQTDLARSHTHLQLSPALTILLLMATIPPPVQIDEANNAHIGSGSELLRRGMQSRTVAKAVPHLMPILDSLPVSAVVLEVGCGPGGITLDVAKRYPHLQVFGVDSDEASIEVT